MNKNKIVAWVILGLIIIVAMIYYFTSPTGPAPKDAEPVACTMDAKQCPDGSYVGRTGPNCEFVCPSVQSNNTTDSTASLTEKTSVVTPPSPADLYK